MEGNISNEMCLWGLFRLEKESTAVRYVKFSRCDNIVSVGWNWRVNIYESGRDKFCEPAVTWTQDAGHKSDIWAVAICDPGIMATGSFDGTIILWNYTSGHEEKQLRPPDFSVEEGKDSTKVTCLMFYQTEKVNGEVDTFLLSAGPNNAIHMWQVG
ncbi:unnamed protein product, partial [Timema podura]|nr:unnamed protein product [Timema podura]